MRQWWKTALSRIGKLFMSVFGLWDKELSPPVTFLNRRALYMRTSMSAGRLFLISSPDSNSSLPIPPTAAGKDQYGFHIIRFDLDTGFHWRGEFFDLEYPSNLIRQVVVGHLAFILTEAFGDPLTNGVRVYRTACNIPSFVRVLHENENIVAMGNDPIYTILISSAGMIYTYENVGIGNDVALVQESDFLQDYGLSVSRAHIFSYSSMLVWGYRNGVSELCWIHRKQGLNGGFDHYGIPTNLTEHVLGDRGRTIEWYIGQSPSVGGISYGLWGRIVVTGTDTWLRLYYYPGTGREFFLVLMRDASLRFHDRWTVGDTYGGRALDWDVKLEDATDTTVTLKVLITKENGMIYGHIVKVHLEEADKYFDTQHASPELWGAGEDVKSAFWAEGWENTIPNPRFEVQGKGKLRFIAVE